MRYGFVVEGNPFNHVVVDLSFDDFMGPVSELFELKQKL
jgi:hypothetical protein